MREEWCSQVNFFTTRAAAQEWAGAHGHTDDVLTVAEVAEDAAARWRSVVNSGPRQGR